MQPKFIIWICSWGWQWTKVRRTSEYHIPYCSYAPYCSIAWTLISTSITYKTAFRFLIYIENKIALILFWSLPLSNFSQTIDLNVSVSLEMQNCAFITSMYSNACRYFFSFCNQSNDNNHPPEFLIIKWDSGHSMGCVGLKHLYKFRTVDIFKHILSPQVPCFEVSILVQSADWIITQKKSADWTWAARALYFNGNQPPSDQMKKIPLLQALSSQTADLL